MFAGLGDFEPNSRGWFGETLQHGRWYELQHLSLLELRELSQHDFDTFDTFAVVRDPYQRLISEYHWRRRLTEGGSKDILPFDTFADLVAAIPLDLDHHFHRYISLADRLHANLLVHLRPQWHAVCDTSGRPDPTVDIVHFERLHNELAPLLHRWHVDGQLAGPTAVSRSLGDYFTDETLAVVNHVYARDFEWFGWTTWMTTP
jgi:hypothetical protein